MVFGALDQGGCRPGSVAAGGRSYDNRRVTVKRERTLRCPPTHQEPLRPRIAGTAQQLAGSGSRVSNRVWADAVADGQAAAPEGVQPRWFARHQLLDEPYRCLDGRDAVMIHGRRVSGRSSKGVGGAVRREFVGGQRVTDARPPRFLVSTRGLCTAEPIVGGADRRHVRGSPQHPLCPHLPPNAVSGVRRCRRLFHRLGGTGEQLDVPPFFRGAPLC